MPVGPANQADQKPARHASRDRSTGESPVKTRTRLSYKEERELTALPEEIESLEREQTELTARMSEPDYHRVGGERLRGDRERHILTERRLKDEPTTLEELASQYGVSRERVRQIEVRAFEKLQKAMRAAATERNLVEA